MTTDPPLFQLSGPAASVWATGQLDARVQLAEGGYRPETSRDAIRIPPAVAAYAVTAYTRPGDTVLDPDCGAGTVLVEALRAGRHTVGFTTHRQWWTLARANVTTAKHNGAPTDGMVLDGPPNRNIQRLAGLKGQVDLLLTALRLTNPNPTAQDPDHPSLPRLLAQCRPLLHPGAHVIIIVHLRRYRGQLLNPLGQVQTAARGAGLIPTERCVALQAELRGDHLAVRASLAHSCCLARQQRATGHPIATNAHLEALIFRVAQQAAAAEAAIPPPHTSPPRCRVLDRLDNDDLLQECAA